MPKQKTNKAAAGRLGISGRGKIMRRKGNINNYRRKKHRRSKGQIDEMMVIHPSLRHRLRRLLPYGR